MIYGTGTCHKQDSSDSNGHDYFVFDAPILLEYLRHVIDQVNNIEQMSPNIRCFVMHLGPAFE